jgi:hypothetical protein
MNGCFILRMAMKNTAKGKTTKNLIVLPAN